MSLSYDGAVAYRLPYEPSRPRLELVPPLLEVRQPSAAVYWRRRVTALVLVSVLSIGAWTLATSGVSWAKQQVSESPAAPAAAAPVASAKTYKVEAGDTLWAIAKKTQPSGDIRPLVDKLSKAHSGKPLQVGETIVLP